MDKRQELYEKIKRLRDYKIPITDIKELAESKDWGERYVYSLLSNPEKVKTAKLIEIYNFLCQKAQNRAGMNYDYCKEHFNIITL